MKILFIHGFSSCGLGDKSKALISYFGQQNVIAPDLSHQPSVAIAQLEKLLQTHTINLIVGASLGGFYATWLKRKIDIPAVLVNPAIKPYASPNTFIGDHSRWCDGETFYFGQDDIDALATMHRETLMPNERYLVLLQTDDDVIDYRGSATYYHDKDVVIEQGGDHRFSNFSDYLSKIATWAEK